MINLREQFVQSHPILRAAIEAAHWETYYRQQDGIEVVVFYATDRAAVRHDNGSISWGRIEGDIITFDDGGFDIRRWEYIGEKP